MAQHDPVDYMQNPPHGQPHHHSHYLLLPVLLGMKQQHEQLQCQLLLQLHHRLLGPLQLTLEKQIDTRLSRTTGLYATTMIPS